MNADEQLLGERDGARDSHFVLECAGVEPKQRLVGRLPAKAQKRSVGETGSAAHAVAIRIGWIGERLDGARGNRLEETEAKECGRRAMSDDRSSSVGIGSRDVPWICRL